MIHASNSIVKSLPTPPAPTSVTPAVTANTTGQIHASDLVPIANLIATHINPIPSTIYRLFQSVIVARTTTHAVFQQIAARKPDPEIEKGNVNHKHFIDTLTEAFEALGGKTWLDNAQTEGHDEDDNLDLTTVANKFAALSLSRPGDDNNGEDEEEGEGDDDEEDEEVIEDKTASSARPRQQRSRKSTKKGKKGKRGKKGRGKTTAKAAVDPETLLKEVPLESYRIIEDETGIVTDYLMAVYSLIQQWTELRSYLQTTWHEVAYHGLNSSVAGAISNIAVAMIKQTESAIFVDFPGHESYDTVFQTITRGNVERAKGMFSMALYKIGPDGSSAEPVKKANVDVEEHFLLHAYNDLFDFITDFQKTRSGKPTKAMLAELRDWDPNLNLERASKAQRLKWRRSYTINWLYDLVNLFSSIVVQRITMKGQHWVLENIDWSVKGPWDKHRRLYGLNEFAGEITTLAMQKPGADIRRRILPHHVFQLQGIVDSLTVSRGWKYDLTGHTLSAPAEQFRPRRDVDLFLDRLNERLGHGYCHGIDVMIQLLEKERPLHDNPKITSDICEMSKEFMQDFVDWLGESKYMSGLTTIPPSRFTSSNSNGLWEYSPYLCGAGLLEALKLSYDLNFFFWDKIPEPMCIVHIHNMLVQKGLLEKPIGLYGTFQVLFQTEFFDEGKVPTTNFYDAFLAVCRKTGSRRATFEQQAFRRQALRTDSGIHGVLSPKLNRFFRRSSLLGVYHDADWLPERIPDEDISVLTSLAMLRLAKTKYKTDPKTGEKKMEDTVLVRRARSLGLKDDMLIEMASRVESISKDPEEEKAIESVQAALPEGYKTMPASQRQYDSSNGLVSSSELLDLLKLDFVSCISGDHPVCAVNYAWATVDIMMWFSRVEQELRRLQNPLWLRAYERDPQLTRSKRTSLTALVLSEQDQQCMEVMAKVFEDFRIGFMTHIYWEDLNTSEHIEPSEDVEATEVPEE